MRILAEALSKYFQTWRWMVSLDSALNSIPALTTLFCTIPTDERHKDLIPVIVPLADMLRDHYKDDELVRDVVSVISSVSSNGTTTSLMLEFCVYTHLALFIYKHLYLDQLCAEMRRASLIPSLIRLLPTADDELLVELLPALVNITGDGNKAKEML